MKGEGECIEKKGVHAKVNEGLWGREGGKSKCLKEKKMIEEEEEEEEEERGKGA